MNDVTCALGRVRVISKDHAHLGSPWLGSFPTHVLYHIHQDLSTLFLVLASINFLPKPSQREGLHTVSEYISRFVKGTHISAYADEPIQNIFNWSNNLYWDHNIIIVP